MSSRCQLGDVSNSPAPGQCPPNLCYTKVEVSYSHHMCIFLYTLCGVLFVL